MSKGIVVKVWNISAGNGKKSASKQMGNSVDYILNGEKCSATLSGESFAQMGRELTYVTNDIKTLEGLYVGGRHIIDLNNAVNEMIQVKQYFGKLEGRLALHGMISLDEAESDVKNAGKLMALTDELMGEIFSDNQCIYAVHTNTENLHVHFILNTVGLDGKKIHMDKEFMKKVMQPTLNKLSVKYGLKPNEEWGRVPKPDIVPVAERKIAFRKLIDLAIEESDDFVSFVKELKSSGLTVNVGTYLSLKTEDMTRPMRTYRLGSNYTIEAIKERIRIKKLDFVKLEMDARAKGMDTSEMLIYTPKILKKYREMNEQEKEEVIKQLKLGNNP